MAYETATAAWLSLRSKWFITLLYQATLLACLLDRLITLGLRALEVPNKRAYTTIFIHEFNPKMIRKTPKKGPEIIENRPKIGMIF